MSEKKTSVQEEPGRAMTAATPLRFRDLAESRPKRVRTRAHLIDSAISEFAARGINATSIDDIVARATVSHGTFYYHFANKQEIVDAVGKVVAVGIGDLVDSRIEGISSGAERVAIASQVFIRIAQAIPEWGWMVVHALADMGTFAEQISRGIRKDVLIGVRSGEFRIDPSDLLFRALLSVVASAIRMRLEMPLDTNVERNTSEIILRVLGVDLEVAHNLPSKMTELYGDVGLDSPSSVIADLERIMPKLLDELFHAER